MPEHSDKFASSLISAVDMELDFTKVPFQFKAETSSGGRDITVNITVPRGNRSRTFHYIAFAEEVVAVPSMW